MNHFLKTYTSTDIRLTIDEYHNLIPKLTRDLSGHEATRSYSVKQGMNITFFNSIKFKTETGYLELGLALSERGILYYDASDFSGEADSVLEYVLSLIHELVVQSLDMWDLNNYLLSNFDFRISSKASQRAAMSVVGEGHSLDLSKVGFCDYDDLNVGSTLSTQVYIQTNDARCILFDGKKQFTFDGSEEDDVLAKIAQAMAEAKLPHDVSIMSKILSTLEKEHTKTEDTSFATFGSVN